MNHVRRVKAALALLQDKVGELERAVVQRDGWDAIHGASRGVLDAAQHMANVANTARASVKRDGDGD